MHVCQYRCKKIVVLKKYLTMIILMNIVNCRVSYQQHSSGSLMHPLKLSNIIINVFVILL